MATRSALIPGLPKAAWNSGAYAWIFSTLEIIPSSVCPISIGFWIGPSAWSSRSAARPSELLLAEQAVHHGGGVARAGLVIDAEGGRPAVGESLLRGVTGGAGDRAVLAEARIEIELVPEIDLDLRYRVLVGNVGRAGLQAQRQDRRVFTRGEGFALGRGRRRLLRLLRRAR